MKKRRGFTLLETMLALIVFSMAVVALVEAVNQLGKQTLLRRREATMQERLRSLLLLEQTRTPVPNPKEEIKLKEGDTTYTIRRTKLELTDRDGQAVQGLFEIRVTAEWLEGREVQQATAETWVYPPIFEP